MGFRAAPSASQTGAKCTDCQRNKEIRIFLTLPFPSLSGLAPVKPRFGILSSILRLTAEKRRGRSQMSSARHTLVSAEFTVTVWME